MREGVAERVGGRRLVLGKHRGGAGPAQALRRVGAGLGRWRQQIGGRIDRRRLGNGDGRTERKRRNGRDGQAGHAERSATTRHLRPPRPDRARRPCRPPGHATTSTGRRAAVRWLTELKRIWLTGGCCFIPPRVAGAEASNPVLAARLVAPEVCQTAKQRPPKQRKGEAERRKAHTRGRSAQSQRRRWAGSRRAPLLADALAFRRSTAALAKTFRPWLSPVPRFMAAPTDVTPSATRAASSSQTGVGAGRAGFRTAREWSYEPHPGHRSRSHQSAVTG